MTRNTFSDVGPSTMSQPVNIDSAPRLTAPRRNRRREDCGNNFAASLTRSFGSMPDAVLRGLAILFPSASKDHRAQALRHQKRERNMDRQKRHDRGYGEEVHVTRPVVTAEQRSEIFELHRLPDRSTGQRDDDAGQNDAEIKQPLHGVVDGKIVVRELAAQSRREIVEHIARADREQLAAEAPSEDAERDIDDEVNDEEPHGGEMP